MNETQAVTVQLKKALDLLKQGLENPAKVSDQHKLELDTAMAMMKSWASHRGMDDSVTYEQCLELALVMQEYSRVAQQLGHKQPTLEELWPEAQKLMNMPKPEQH